MIASLCAWFPSPTTRPPARRSASDFESSSESERISSRRWQTYGSLREAADNARRPHGAVELEIVEGEVRFRIGRAIWEDALTFGQAVGRFKRRV